MFSNPISRTLAILGFHGRAHDEAKDLRSVFGTAEGETPTPVAPPRIPPHQRHLHQQQDEALRGYSMGVYRPAASSVTTPGPDAPTAKPAKKAAKAHKDGAASPATA
jgi:hypothetical protein